MEDQCVLTNKAKTILIANGKVPLHSIIA